MSYINTAWITDRHCKDIATRQDITETLTLADSAINAVVQMKGVDVGDIPVDARGYLTSTALIDYGRFWVYVELLSNYWGSAHGENDIYYEKLQWYRDELAKTESKLTKDNILNNSPLNQSSFIYEVPIY